METALLKFLAKGTTLQNGKYTILDILGHGGFGITYLANDKSFGKVAIKELFLNSADIHCSRENITLRNVVPQFDNEQFTKFKNRFESEARTLFNLTEINGVVRVLNIFEENNTIYFSMEFLDGEKLEDYILRKGKLSDTEGTAMVNAIGKTVSEIHQHDLLHCDIKPSNIIITKSGRIVLIDFGIARSNLNGQEDHTTFHTRIYSPPEQQVAKSPMGKYSDVYSLGATAYFIFTGVPPQSIEERITGKYEDAKHFNRNLPNHINNAITKSLEIKKEERFQTAEAFLAALNGTPQPQKQQNPSEDNTRIEPLPNPKPIDRDQATLIDNEHKKNEPQPSLSSDATRIEIPKSTPIDSGATLLDPIKTLKKPVPNNNQSKKWWLIGSGIASAIGVAAYMAMPHDNPPPVPLPAPQPIIDSVIKPKDSISFVIEQLTGKWLCNDEPLTFISTPDLTLTWKKNSGVWNIKSVKNDTAFLGLLIGTDDFQFISYPLSASKKMQLQGTSGDFKKLNMGDKPIFKRPSTELTAVPVSSKLEVQKTNTPQIKVTTPSPYHPTPVVSGSKPKAPSPPPPPPPSTTPKPTVVENKPVTPSVAQAWTEERLMAELANYTWKLGNETLNFSTDKTFKYDKMKGTWRSSTFTPKLEGMTLLLNGKSHDWILLIKKNDLGLYLELNRIDNKPQENKYFFK